jgi:predicted nucleic acid-binding protein
MSLVRNIPSTVSAQNLVVLDASVWVSRTINTDTNHAVARRWIDQHLRARGAFVVPLLFQVEIAAAIARVTKDTVLASRQVAQLRRLNARRLLRFVPLNAHLVKAATTLAINFGLRAADAVYAALAQSLSIPLVTFDTELLRLPSSTITTIRP